MSTTHSRIVNILVLTSAVLALASPVAAAATNFIFDVPGAIKTVPLSINNNGDVTGWCTLQTGVSGFVRSATGAFTTFAVSGALTTVATGINNYGEIAGYWSDSGGFYHSFFRSSQGVMTTFDAPGTLRSSSAIGIDDNGTVAGTYDTAQTYLAYLRYSNGDFDSFGAPGDSMGLLNVLIGANGDVAGTYYANTPYVSGVPRPFVRNAGGGLVPISFPGAAKLFANGINASGQITGAIGAASGPQTAGFVLVNGRVEPFQVNGSVATVPISINKPGDVTGYSLNSQTGFSGFSRTSNGNITVFQVGVETISNAINDFGVITGTADQHGFLRTPNFR